MDVDKLIMLVVALTGGIACGKTTVAELFEKLGVPIIDTDVIARQLVEPGEIALTEIVETFGSEYLLANGHLNRAALAAHCFAQESQRKKLENILHPKIRLAMNKELLAQKSPYAIAVIPLLVETEKNPIINRVLVVHCSIEQQQQRLQNRDQRPIEQIEAILKVQASAQQRLEIADDIIHNTGYLKQLKIDVNKFHQQYISMASINE